MVLKVNLLSSAIYIPYPNLPHKTPTRPRSMHTHSHLTLHHPTNTTQLHRPNTNHTPTNTPQTHPKQHTRKPTLHMHTHAHTTHSNTTTQEQRRKPHHTTNQYKWNKKTPYSLHSNRHNHHSRNKTHKILQISKNTPIRGGYDRPHQKRGGPITLIRKSHHIHHHRHIFDYVSTQRRITSGEGTHK